MHGAGLVRELKRQDEQAVCQAWGGDLMTQAGASVLKHYRELAFMGFVEVVRNLPTILRNMKTCKQQIESFRPDALILIDYPGFNLRIARWAHEQGYAVYYYISPQIWAWHRSRVHQIKRFVHRMFVILPFEREFYASYGVEVSFVGHPLLDVVLDWQPSADFRTANGLDERPIVALLPGSRRQEIERILPTMAQVASSFSPYQFVIGVAPAQPLSYYREVLAQVPDSQSIACVQGQTYELLAHAQAALVGSGTATLETALFGVPEVVCYRGSQLSYAIARRLVDIKYISLVNLIMDRPLVTELIQHELSPERLKQELTHVLSERGRAEIKAGYEELRHKLGEKGAAFRTVAAILAEKNGSTEKMEA